MRVVSSNCGCCGIKHIRDFPYRPSADVYVHTGEGHDEDQCSVQPEPYEPWNNAVGSKNVNSGDYFRSLVAQIKDRRPAGFITLNLAAEYEGDDEYCCEECNGPYDDWSRRHSGDDHEYNTAQVDAWRPIFQELGFEEETFFNSNSSNRVHHFTLNYKV